MQLTHTFTVPTSVDDAWAHFNDIASVAECFPGAQVTSFEGDTFEGTCKVKLGPIAMQYKGSGTFIEKDEAAHRFVVEAKGKDKRGNGTAGANVTLSMAESGSNTDVEVLTDLAVTGKPAQFGRGVMQDVSDKLLGQFVACLEERLGGGANGGPAPEPDQGADPTAAAAGTATAASTDTSTDRDAERASEPPSAPAQPAAAAAPAPTQRPAPPRQQQSEEDDAINLGTTVLPILVKSYWKQAAAALVVVLLIIWLVARD